MKQMHPVSNPIDKLINMFHPLYCYDICILHKNNSTNLVLSHCIIMMCIMISLLTRRVICMHSCWIINALIITLLCNSIKKNLIARFALLSHEHIHDMKSI